jgi:Na+/H+-dicarboxylate symporter/ABC-type amino acid transport substrate-binding protein
VTLSRRIILGLVAGIATGLFFGERAAVLDWPARAFVQLLGVTVLPYLVTSLISGIARGTPEQSRRLLSRAGLALLLLWAVSLALVFVSPLALPPDKGGSSYATAAAAADAPIDWLELYIPANPFRSLANNVVPAVVVFSALLGVALLGLPGKARILAGLDLASDLLGRAGNLVVALTPIGVFAMAGHAAGTLRFEEFERLQAYLVLIVGLNSILTLWILPGLIVAITGAPYRRTLSLVRDALITAFLTGNLFVVLPQLQDAAKALLAEGHPAGGDTPETVAVLVPTAFTFPHSGKLLSLAFLLFAGWFAGTPIAASQYPMLAGAGLLTLFGNLNTAIPFLLDTVRLPADLFNLFGVSSVINARFGSAAAAMHTFALAVIGAHLVAGRPVGSAARLLRFAGITAAIVGAFVVGSRIVLAATLPGPEGAAATFDRLRVSGAWGQLAPIEPMAAAATVPAPPPVTGTRLAAIRQRGVLRACVSPDGMPWCFRNGRGEIVGFDVGLAHILAVELRTKLTLVPVARTARGAALADGTCDVATNRIVPSEAAMSFTVPVAYEAWAFMTRDYRRGDFATVDRIRELEKPRIAVLRIQEWMDRLHAILPDAEIVPIDSITEFLEAPEGRFDATFTGADRASAYSLVAPQFGAVVPSPGLGSVPIAIAVPRGEHELMEVLNAVVEDGLASGLFANRINYWIKGGGARAEREPRWSIGGNMLGLWEN